MCRAVRGQRLAERECADPQQLYFPDEQAHEAAPDGVAERVAVDEWAVDYAGCGALEDGVAGLDEKYVMQLGF